MLDNIVNMFKKELQLGHTAALINHVANIVNIFRADFLKDADSKNAAIDAVCELLQQQKDQPPGQQDG